MGLGICWLHLADLPPSKVFIHYSISNVVGPHIKVLVTYRPNAKTMVICHEYRVFQHRPGKSRSKFYSLLMKNIAKMDYFLNT